MKKIITAILFFGLSLTAIAAQKTSLQDAFAKLEASSDGRLGIAAINTANNQIIHYRADEKFPMASTVKLVVVGAILHNSMKNPALLKERIRYKKSQLATWGPITEKHVAEGMTVEELCSAAISYSDGTAMDLLVNKLGGAQPINQFARSLQDPHYHLRADNDTEASTTTPEAMRNTLQKLAINNSLGPKEQGLLQKWLKANTTGDLRIRAGVPNGWVVGDKTGSGATHGTTNDIAVIWPPQNRPPIVLAIYYTSDKESAKKRTDLLASVTRVILSSKEFT